MDKRYAKPIFTSLLLVLISLLPELKASDLPLKSKIKKVTVFLQGAQVIRSGQLNLTKGEYTIVINGLPAQLNPASIQVAGEGDLVVLGVTHSVDFLNKQQQSEHARLLDAQLKQLKQGIAREQTSLLVLQKEEALILANQKLGGEQQGVSVEALRQAAAFFRQRLNDMGFAK